MCMFISLLSCSLPTYDFQISTTFFWQDKSSEKEAFRLLGLQIEHRLMRHRWVEIVVHSLVVGLETRLNTAT